mgnify:CR=1 FL=1
MDSYRFTLPVTVMLGCQCLEEINIKSIQALRQGHSASSRNRFAGASWSNGLLAGTRHEIE